MKSIILILFAVLSFVSCKKQSNQLRVIISRSDLTDSTEIVMSHLSLESKDSVIYKANRLIHFSCNDTLTFDSLSNGNYSVKYIDIIGNKISKTFNLNGKKPRAIGIICDSINANNFDSKTPFYNLKDGESYMIESKGSCVASMYSYYRISRSKDNYYYESVNIPKKDLNHEQIKAVKKFEAELLAIYGKGVCGGTGRMTYTIIKAKTEISIPDHACNWSGWNTMMRKVNY